MKNMKRSVALLVAIALLIGCAAGGTMAWLTMKTDSVVNTFTTSDIKITLTETDPEGSDPANNNYKMVPGATITKNPIVTVTSDSEDCYVFVKVEETGGNVEVGETQYKFDSFIAYNVKTTDSNPWIALTGYTGVYYKVIDTADEKNVNHLILGGGSYTFNGSKYTWADNQVLTKPEVTKEMMKAINESPSEKPVLKFTAYAIQKSGFADAAAAWTEASK